MQQCTNYCPASGVVEHCTTATLCCRYQQQGQEVEQQKFDNGTVFSKSKSSSCMQLRSEIDSTSSVVVNLLQHPA